MRHITSIVTAIATASLLNFSVSLPSQASETTVLLLEKVSIDQRSDLPRTGQSMDQIRQQFGEPLNQRGPVGEPPISTWEYADFSVYFEHRHVINSVRHFRRQDAE